MDAIGAHCELERCGSLDLLPIKCTGCQRVFCRHHVPLSLHSCPSLERNQRDPEDLKEVDAASKRERCAFSGCQKVTLESVIVDKTQPQHRVVATCPQCNQAYCAVHRHPSDHACTRVQPAALPSEKNPEAHALLLKHFPTASTSRVASAPSNSSRPLADPKKIARLRAVELMKMRHHALPADPKDKTISVPATQRVHFKVVLASAETQSDNIFWLRKTVVTGKALDLIADRVSVRISDTTPAYLEKLSNDNGTPTRLTNSELLSEQIEDGETVYLSLGPS